MKRVIFAIVATCAMTLCFPVFAKGKAEAKKSIVCTIFPQYDWCREILGDKIEDFNLTLLLDKGADLHSFQPSFSDIAKISECDMFVYVGGESDDWVSGVLEEAKNKDMIVVNLMETLGDNVKEEELVEGMQPDEDEHEHDEGEDEEHEYDEHVWLSLRNAAALTRALSESIQTLDPENAAYYTENTKQYISELDSLDKEFADVVANAKFKTVVFADRFPFRYLTDDYNLDYYAAFVGCSAESEASFGTVIFLARRLDELNLNCVLTIEKSDKKIARTVVQNTTQKNQQILEMDSLQSVTRADIRNGKTYLSAMKENLSVLNAALN